MQITLEHLTKRFGDTVAVNDLCVTLESGKLTGMLTLADLARKTLYIDEAGAAGAVRLRKIHRTEYDIRHSARVCGPRFV